MILSINGLALPASTESHSEIFTQVTSHRTVGGKLVTRYGYEKHRCTFALPESESMTLEYQAQFYAACAIAKRQAVEVVFVDSATNTTMTAMMKCTEVAAPGIMSLFNRRPQYYRGISATFEQV